MEKCVNSFLTLRFEEHDEQATNQDITVGCDDCQLHIKRLYIQPAFPCFKCHFCRRQTPQTGENLSVEYLGNRFSCGST